VDRLSGGQTQRVRFALAIFGQSELIVLDEPTTAMDVETRANAMCSIEASAYSRTIAEIAARIYLSEGTVRNYLSACIGKTGPVTAPRRCESPQNGAGSKPIG